MSLIYFVGESDVTQSFRHFSVYNVSFCILERRGFFFFKSTLAFFISQEEFITIFLIKFFSLFILNKDPGQSLQRE